MERSASPPLPEIYLLPAGALGEPVVYGAVRIGACAREWLAARLLEALSGPAPEWTGAPDWGPLTLSSDPRGRPLLWLGSKPGPGISFSEAGEQLWGALAAQGQVGLDAAPAADFSPPYPYARVFGPEEWDWAWRHCRGRTVSAAALLWAAKEAAVKALGVGFHNLEPGGLQVVHLAPAWEGLQLLVRVPPDEVKAWVRPWPWGWLAVTAI